MNRTELVSAVAKNAGVTATSVDATLNAIIAVITDEVAAGRRVSIPGFLTFETADRPARTGRNPRTGEPVEIAARRAVKVSAGSALKRAAAG